MIIRMWHGRVKILARHEDDGFLLEFEPSVVHYEVVGRS